MNKKEKEALEVREEYIGDLVEHISYRIDYDTVWWPPEWKKELKERLTKVVENISIGE